MTIAKIDLDEREREAIDCPTIGCLSLSVCLSHSIFSSFCCTVCAFTLSPLTDGGKSVHAFVCLYGSSTARRCNQTLYMLRRKWRLYFFDDETPSAKCLPSLGNVNVFACVSVSLYGK